MVEPEFFMKRLLAVVLMSSLAMGVYVRGETPATQPSPESKKSDADRRNRGGNQHQMPPQGVQAMILRIDELMKELNVSDDQRRQIDEILNRARGEMQSLREEMRDSDLAPRERLARLRDTMRKYHDEIAALLTEEQRAIFLEKVQAWATTGPGGMMLDRIQNVIKELELTPEQQSQIEAILSDAKTKADELRKEAETSSGQLRDKFRSLMQDTRAKLGEVLTPEQKEKLQEMLPGRGNGPRDGARRGDGPRRGGPEKRHRDKDGDKEDKSKSTEPDDADDAPSESTQSGAGPGDTAPNFDLRKLDGLPVQLSSFQGRILVIEFGSYSSPSFRDRVKDMEQLKRDLGARVNFLVIYTKEAHAEGEWDVQQNKDADITVAQHVDENTRKDAARVAKDKLKISIPIALDSMDDSTAAAYEGMSNAAVIIDRDGFIAYRQKWCDPVSLRRKIEELLKRPATTPA
jgi:Spy/CpxP family protein refolding chaperone